MTTDSTLLSVKNLKTYYYLEDGVVRAVDGVSFELGRSTVIGVVGESGCGKSVLARSIMRIIRPPGRTLEGEIIYHRLTGNGGRAGGVDTIDLAQLPATGSEIREIRGGEITMVFQEPMVSFSPVHTIGNQIVEAIVLHQKVNRLEARDTAVAILERVGIPNPDSRIDEYSFRLSGGMRQRAMIALALSSNPKMLIADEPTTALDVTTQAQILELMAELQQEYGMAMMLITHNLGVVAQMTEEIIVMYLGKVVERADTKTLFRDPKHPYTQELMKSIPRLSRTKQVDRLTTIAGMCRRHSRGPRGALFIPGARRPCRESATSSNRRRSQLALGTRPDVSFIRTIISR